MTRTEIIAAYAEEPTKFHVIFANTTTRNISRTPPILSVTAREAEQDLERSYEDTTLDFQIADESGVVPCFVDDEQVADLVPAKPNKGTPFHAWLARHPRGREWYAGQNLAKLWREFTEFTENADEDEDARAGATVAW